MAGRLEVEMHVRLSLKWYTWPLVTRLVGLPLAVELDVIFAIVPRTPRSTAIAEATLRLEPSRLPSGTPRNTAV
jgi:hypothetical protein